jgi:glycosyltransferase involved in cell wall biosynthesis
MVVEEPQTQHKNTAYQNSLEKALPTIQLYNHNSNGSEPAEISVIMPALNEEKAVGNLLDRTLNSLQKITSNYEIIVIDDGSKDQTLDICRKKHVTIIHNRYNFGKGYALREGFRHARGDIIITIDADGDHNPEEIPLLYQELKNGNADVVLGTRFNKKNNHLVTTVFNTFGNKLFNFLIKCLTNHDFTDSQCGFRGFQKKYLKNLPIHSKGYSIETEMLIALTKKGVRIHEVPISSPVTYYRKSNINRILDGLSIIYKIFKSSFK